MARSKRRGAGTRNDAGEVWARIVSYRSAYSISRDERRDGCLIDDEAKLEMIAVIDAITPSQRKLVGEEMAICLLAAEKYGPTEAASAEFFGSVNLRASRRSALAYLPSTPFWALPELIRTRDAWICLS